MSILMFLVFGLVVGLLAQALLSVRQESHPALLGMAGSTVGAFGASLLTGHSVHELHTWGLLGSVLGALFAVLAVAGLSGRQRNIFA